RARVQAPIQVKRLPIDNGAALEREADSQGARGEPIAAGRASGSTVQRLTREAARKSLASRDMEMIEFSSEDDGDGHFSRACVKRTGTYKQLLGDVRDFYISPGQDFIWYTAME